LIIVFIISYAVIFSFAAEKGDNNLINSKAKEEYFKQRISFKTTEEFDVMYPININKFEFFQGDQKITFQDFMKISNDPILIKNQQKISKIKIAGFSTAGIFGGITILFLIPAIVFTVQMTNYHPVNLNYAITGAVCFVLAGTGLISLFMDLIVTFSLLWRFQYSIQAVQQAVDTYNENLRKKLGIMPDMSFDGKGINFNLSYRF
jgi:hypothetical protein